MTYQKKNNRPPREGEGRPAKTTADLPENWKDIVLLNALNGLSDVEIRRELCLSMGVNPDSIRMLWYKLKERDAEFRETINLCREFQEAWWIAASRESLNKQFFQHNVWFANMKNRFGWKDKTEVEHGMTDETYEKFKTLSVSDIQKQLDELMPNRVQKLLT